MLVWCSELKILLSKHIFVAVTGYNPKFVAQCNSYSFCLLCLQVTTLGYVTILACTGKCRLSTYHSNGPVPPIKKYYLAICGVNCWRVYVSINYSEFAFNNAPSFKSMYLSEYIIFIITGHRSTFIAQMQYWVYWKWHKVTWYTQQIPKLCTSLLHPSILRHCTTETKCANVNT